MATNRNLPLSQSANFMGQVNNNDEFFREYGFDSAGPAPPGNSMNLQNQAQTQSTYSTFKDTLKEP